MKNRPVVTLSAAMLQVGNIGPAVCRMLICCRQQRRNSQACKAMATSRDSFDHFKEPDDKGGELALHEIGRNKPVLNRVPQDVADASSCWLALLLRQRCERFAESVERQRNGDVTSGGVGERQLAGAAGGEELF